MKKTLLFCLAVLCVYILPAQVIITDDDMPDIKEIYVVQISNSFGSSFDYDSTGTDIIWDISDITYNTQRSDTFVAVASTPFIYNLFFNNLTDPERRATIATPRNMSIPAPGVSVTDVYIFLKESPDKFSEVGFGATINGIPTPIKYDTPDVLYRFPITYGTQDTSFSKFSLNIPTYGYYGQEKMRINSIDGWGTVVTAGVNYPVMRIKSVIHFEDTLFVDQFQNGFKFNRTETEYKWLTPGIGVPALYIIERMNAVTMEVFDSLYMNTAGLSEINQNHSMSVYPNPAQDYIYITYSLDKPANIFYRLTDMSGKTVFEINRGNISAGMTMDRLDIKDYNLSAGFYNLSIETPNERLNKKLMIN